MSDCVGNNCHPELRSKESSASNSWELSQEELESFMLVAELLTKPYWPMDYFLNNHVTRDNLRHAFEKIMARADSRRVLTNSEKELAYLKERIHDAKGWLRIGMTHQLWGSITDGYAALDNGRVPPVKKWQTEAKLGIRVPKKAKVSGKKKKKDAR